MEEEINIDEKLLEKDPKMLEFIYENAINLNNNIRTISDKNSSKATVLLTGCIILIVAIMPMIQGILSIIQQMESDNIVDTIIASLLLLSFILFLVYVFVAFLKFHAVLQNKNFIFPYLPPLEFFKNKVSTTNITKTKIEIIKLLQYIISENHKKSVEKAKAFTKGMKRFKIGVISLLFSFIMFLVLHYKAGNILSMP